MPRARGKRDRLHQVANWLRAKYPTPYPVVLRVQHFNKARKPLEDFGECVRLRGKFIIRIESRLPLRISVETLLHEWAHACTWPRVKLENHEPEHSDPWGLVYAQMYRAFYEENGDEACDKYPWNKGSS